MFENLRFIMKILLDIDNISCFWMGSGERVSWNGLKTTGYTHDLYCPVCHIYFNILSWVLTKDAAKMTTWSILAYPIEILLRSCQFSQCFLGEILGARFLSLFNFRNTIGIQCYINSMIILLINWDTIEIQYYPNSMIILLIKVVNWQKGVSPFVLVAKKSSQTGNELESSFLFHVIRMVYS